jgi:hypothetical protein
MPFSLARKSFTAFLKTDPYGSCSLSGNQKGSTFVTIKKPIQDLVNSTSLSRIRQTGFPVRGICSDIWSVASNDDNEIVDEEELGASGIETMKFRESYREILRDFEEKYWEFGGRTGGW